MSRPDLNPHNAKVISRYGADALILLPDHQVVKAKSKRKNQDLVCGDNIIWRKTDNNEYLIVDILPRKNALVREYFRGSPRLMASNLTQLFIITAEKPACDWKIVDHMLCNVELDLKIPAALIQNKSDLPVSDSTSTRFKAYERIGYEVIPTSKYEPESIELLDKRLKKNTTAIVGQSGMGKSTIINRLDPELDLSTQALSVKSGLGQHTTSNAHLYVLKSGGEIIDTPGIRDFTPLKRDKSEWQHGFKEFAPYLGQCRFHNCLHISEPDCAVKQATIEGTIESFRYDAYKDLVTG